MSEIPTGIDALPAFLAAMVHSAGMVLPLLAVVASLMVAGWLGWRRSL